MNTREMKKRIISGKTILLNTATNTTFIANELMEKTQCEGPNRNHIEWAGELDIPVPNVSKVLRDLYEDIKHGDEAHQKWLKEKIEEFIMFNDL